MVRIINECEESLEIKDEGIFSKKSTKNLGQLQAPIMAVAKALLSISGQVNNNDADAKRISGDLKSARKDLDELIAGL